MSTLIVAAVEVTESLGAVGALLGSLGLLDADVAIAKAAAAVEVLLL